MINKFLKYYFLLNWEFDTIEEPLRFAVALTIFIILFIGALLIFENSIYVSVLLMLIRFPYLMFYERLEKYKKLS